MYLCGMVDKRTLEKYEKEAKEAGRESWYLSWALDSTSQEREKVRFCYPDSFHFVLITFELIRARRSRSDAPTLRLRSDDTRSSTRPATRTLSRP